MDEPSRPTSLASSEAQGEHPPAPHDLRRARALESLDVGELAKALEAETTQGFAFGASPRRAVQVAAAYDLMSGDGQERFKEALTLAVAEWRVVDGWNRLRYLAELSGLVGAGRTVRSWRQHLRRGLAEDLGPESRAARSSVLACLIRFASLGDAYEGLRDVEGWGVYQSQHAGEILVGLCSHEPEAWTRHVVPFVAAVDAYPDAYPTTEFLALRVVEEVGVGRIAETLHRIPEPTRRKALQFLASSARAPLEVVGYSGDPAGRGERLMGEMLVLREREDAESLEYELVPPDDAQDVSAYWKTVNLVCRDGRRRSGRPVSRPVLTLLERARRRVERDRS